MRELPSGEEDAALVSYTGGELTPVQKQMRRKSRRQLGMIMLVALGFGIAALVAAIVAGQESPAVKPKLVPAGYRAVSDGYFAYAVPSAWTQNDAFTDNVGDLLNGGRIDWAGEHVAPVQTAPTRSASPPAALLHFGGSSAATLGPASPFKLAGVDVAYEYTVRWSGGVSGVAIDAWSSATDAQLWLLVRADATITSQIVASLRAG